MAKKATARKGAKKAARGASGNGNGRSRPMDAIQLLKADHRTVEELFEKFETAKGGGARFAASAASSDVFTSHSPPTI